ncbi:MULTISPECIES: DUF2524 family protein [Pontibacillus]|uniref:DUF2524 family protein n=1 Tax=Pontibacillus chungwhensis TaxID=265426 RepID=A0ABY8UVG2_9BACI|nr:MULTISPECIES: DUF2524 family protein [Pontibacillus]MCD5325041.1 YtzC family protein [Pontibacillus sp. HN14]WIF97298.1 DUF2524 family protein [Pontibacillus chungwhensis]
MMMATRDSIENMVEVAKRKMEAAREQLEQANQVGYQPSDEYSQVQLGLEEAETEIQKLMHSANHQQKDQLHRLHLQVTQVLNDMILDHEDLGEYKQQ